MNSFRVHPSIKGVWRSSLFKLRHPRKDKFECPACLFYGPFIDVTPKTGQRLHALCPRCGALERHRLQILVAKNIFAKIDTDSLRMLHFAPEAFFRTMFSRMFAVYETADIDMENVDHCVDLQELPFSSATYDVVWASHVLEHVKDDLAAVREIRRILKPGGIAVLPVPLVVSATIEYPEPNVNESKHVRAPGPDYYDRFREHFSRVDLFSSSAFPEKHQVYIHENRLDLPNSLSPFRTAMTGSRHLDIVPVCYV